MSLAYRILGVVLVLLGIALNRWTLARFVLYDGVVESTAKGAAIAIVQLGLVGSGAWLFLRAPRLGAPPLANLALLGISGLLGLLLCEPAFRLLDPDYAPAQRAYVGERENRVSPNFEPDPHTGWRMRPSRAFEWTHDGRATSYRSNARGFRAQREFVPGGVPVVGLAGDSFTWGTGVAYPETFGARLEQRLAGVEVRNYAMPGFGVDQMWMSVRHQALPDRPALVVVAFIDDDFTRSLTAYRHGEGFNKPTFVVRRGALRPQTREDAPTGVLRLMHDRSRIFAALAYRAERLRPFGNWWELNLAVLEGIAADCVEAGAPLLILRLPQKKQGGFRVLERELTRRGLAFVDVGERIGPRDRDFFLVTDDHPSPTGHERVAGILADWIGRALPGLASAR